MPRLCVFGCAPSDVPMHRFPDAVKFPERFKTWVYLVGGKLDNLSDFEYYQKKRVCDIHFCDEHKNHSKRLSALAIPSLHLPQSSTSQVVVEESSSTQSQLPSISQTVVAEPSTSQVVVEELSFSQSQVPSIFRPMATEPSSSQVVVEELSSSQYQMPSISRRVATGQTRGHAALTWMEHNYSLISKPRRTVGKDLMGPLRTKIKRLQTEVSRLLKKGQSFKARLKSAEDLSSKSLMEHFSNNFKTPAQLFLRMQLQASKRPKGRRFTTKEKILSLSLYKKSPKAYNLLNKLFTLPSAKSLKRLLSTIKIHEGIVPIVFERIKKTISEIPNNDRLCSVIFDEMSLTPQINYNAQKDVLEGFAYQNPKRIADHVLVFMVKGIKKKFKQPIAYYFTAGLNKILLKNIIIDVIYHAQRSGLKIINTVCDQSTINVGAITELVNDTKAEYMREGREWRYDHFTVNKKIIIPLFDVPHLIKGMRNNLITKDLMYKSNNIVKIVKWEYYQKVYAADKSYGELRLLDKITEEHVNPEKINKMRVKSATQIFSHSVAVATEHLAARGDLPEECKQLIEITLLLDNLFDSLNVNTFHIPNGKKYKGPVKRHSPHHELWRQAKLILKTIKFRYTKIVGNKTRLTETNIPSVINLIKTIEGMEAIWKIVSQRYGFDALLTRNFNQDPVENFFGNIRSYGARNNSPNTISFESAYKALLLNNYNSPHSGGANCEEDSNKCLQTLEFFFTEKQVKCNPDNSVVPKENETIAISEDILNINRGSDAGQRSYVCGWVLTKCLKYIVKNCKNCRQNLIDKGDKNRNLFIKAKEYCNKKWLCYPSEELENCFHDLQNIVTAFLKQNIPEKNIKSKITIIADIMVDFPFNCTSHQEKLKIFFINTTINVIIYSWCRSINRILCGKLTYDGDDHTKIAAQEYYNKHKHYKNKK